jgi:hypothetical protein
LREIERDLGAPRLACITVPTINNLYICSVQK